MRVTNIMMTNKMLQNINRNLNQVSDLNTQMSTTKRIQTPSDNPIRAARALKFRTNITETEQYMSNVEQGLSWMQVSIEAFKNISELMTKIKVLCVQAANGDNTYEEREKIAAEMDEMMGQIGAEMNVTYAGRYVFSGFRTDTAPLYETDAPNESYAINQEFSLQDMETTKSFQKITDPSYGNTSEPIVQAVHLLKLPYQNIDSGSITITGTTATVTETSINDPIAYTPAANQIQYIKETGELVLGATAVADLTAQNFGILYTKTGFIKGQLNPVVNFTCTDLRPGGLSYDMDEQELPYEFSVNTRIPINSLCMDIYTDKMFADFQNLIGFAKRINVSDADQLFAKQAGQNPTWSEAQVNKAVQEQLVREKQEIESALHDRFNNALGFVDEHFSAISTQDTNMGSRMSRMELIKTRLNENKITYTELLSKNEDADVVETAIQLSAAESAYQASLQAGAKIVQVTLADYI